MDIGEKTNITFFMENINEEYDLQITRLNILVPENLEITKKPQGTSLSNQVITWSGNIKIGDNATFITEIRGIAAGKSSISAEATFKISKFIRTIEKSSDIEVYCDCPYIYHEFSKKITAPGEKVNLKVFIINPSSAYDFSNLNT